MKFVLVIILFWVLIFPKNANAYLDPGSGSYIMQIIIGFILGALVGVKIFWVKIREFMKGIFARFFKSNEK